MGEIELELKHRQNYISVDSMTAINSYGEIFSVGDVVKHESEGDTTAIIESFYIDIEYNEIKAKTNLGTCHIDFIYKEE